MRREGGKRRGRMRREGGDGGKRRVKGKSKGKRKRKEERRRRKRRGEKERKKERGRGRSGYHDQTCRLRSEAHNQLVVRFHSSALESGQPGTFVGAAVGQHSTHHCSMA